MNAEATAARLARAALLILTEAMPENTEIKKKIGYFAYTIDMDFVYDEDEDTEPDATVDTTEIRWADVQPGDQVQAPNGQWYPVDSVARTGAVMKVLLVMPTGSTVGTSRNADDTVLTQRGDTGKAVDMFAAAGMTLEAIR